MGTLTRSCTTHGLGGGRSDKVFSPEGRSGKYGGSSTPGEMQRYTQTIEVFSQRYHFTI
jgi:hypothetical protein